MNESALDQAMALHRGGLLDRAAKAYEAVLEAEPRNADALHLLAVVRRSQGDLAAAQSLVEKALVLAPGTAIFHSTRGSILADRGALDEAIEVHRRAVSLAPNRGELFVNLAIALHRAERNEDAITAFRGAISRDPKLNDAWIGLARTLADIGRKEEAAAAYAAAVGVDRKSADAICGLATIVAELGEVDSAFEMFEHAITLDPSHVDTRINYALSLCTVRRAQEALVQATKAVELAPRSPKAQSALGTTLDLLGRRADAASAYRSAQTLAPEDVTYLVRTAWMLIQDGRASEARERLEEAREQRPDDPRLLEALAEAYLYEGRMQESLDAVRRSIALDPTSLVARSFLLGIAYANESISDDELIRTATEWGKLACERNPRMPPPTPSRDPDRKLRIGYLGHYVCTLLPHHDLEKFEIFNYVNRYGPLAEGQRVGTTKIVSGMSDKALADLIRKNEIDILVDLSGHAERNRLQVFARKPAPIQVTWLGYYATTGLQPIDWIIADDIVLPPGDEQWFVERPWRIEGCYFALRKLRFPISVSALPAREPGAVTFSNFNNLAKLSEPTVKTWSRILHELPRSKLVMRARFAPTHDVITDRFVAHGARREQIVFLPFVPRLDLMRSYHDVDIALDPFPYNGGMTTTEALYMGIPPIVKRGKRFVARVGETYLRAIDHRELCAEDEDEYVAKAIALANDLDRLRTLRAELRDRVLDTVCDTAGFMLKLEAAFRGMWKTWLEETA